MKKIITSLDKAISYIKSCYANNIDPDKYSVLFPDILNGVMALNENIYGHHTIKGNNIVDLLSDVQLDCLNNLFSEYELWKNTINSTLSFRDELPTYIDKEFYKIMDYAAFLPFEIIRQKVIDSLFNASQYLANYQFYYQKYKHLWGTLDIGAGNYEVIDNRVNSLINNRDRFIALYNRLGDYRSKLVLTKMLTSWITFGGTSIEEMKEGNFPDYYDLDLLKCDENEVLVDIGAFTGDSAELFIQSYGKYKRIYCYEITPETVIILENNMSKYSNVVIRNKGAADAAGEMYIGNDIGVASDGSANKLESAGSRAIEVVTIDDDIDEPISIIKMDIEGAEKSALKGCENHIKNEKPKLLICVYHNNSDIVDIPEMIDKMREDYKFYLRSNGDQWGPSEIVLFAL